MQNIETVYQLPIPTVEICEAKIPPLFQSDATWVVILFVLKREMKEKYRRREAR